MQQGRQQRATSHTARAYQSLWASRAGRSARRRPPLLRPRGGHQASKPWTWHHRSLQLKMQQVQTWQQQWQEGRLGYFGRLWAMRCCPPAPSGLRRSWLYAGVTQTQQVQRRHKWQRMSMNRVTGCDMHGPRACWLMPQLPACLVNRAADAGTATATAAATV